MPTMGKTDVVGEATRLPPPEAERLLQKHLRKRPRDIAAAEALADLLAGQSRLGELADKLTKLAHAGGATAGLIRYARDAAVLQNDHATALAISTLGTKRFPEDAMLWYRRGKAELANANAAAAAKSFKIAHELEPDDNIILAALADADLSKGSFPLSDQYAIEILDREPEVASHHARHGTSTEQQTR